MTQIEKHRYLLYKLLLFLCTVYSVEGWDEIKCVFCSFFTNVFFYKIEVNTVRLVHPFLTLK
jgi:hypothetical protein